ncbi:MAG: glycoside hydrolase family 3 N-terminal domain-containing protein [Legionella sp.]|nr:glycoside hydrolase family 3 N-terminal domain-containing protein [Legionella sp.]
MATLRQQIGQMLIMGFNGLEIDETNPITHWLSKDGLGGVLLFDTDLANNGASKNLVSRQQIIHLTNQLNQMATKSDKDGLPLFIAIDYEGGAVDRLKNISGCMTTLKPVQMAALSESELIEQLQQMAATLKSLGFNLNFAPAIDLDLNDKEGIIGRLGRSFSRNPREVARLASQFVKVFSDYGISCCFKHFPGHGSATGDSHEGFVDVSNSFQSEELDPYRILLQQDSHPTMVMTAHVINRQLDDSGMPATLSHKILTNLLREKTGFDGVIISDDLQMKAISNHYSVEEALKLTINAGADMVIFANQLGYISATTVIDTIENLVKSHQISLARIEQAYQRISHLKQSQAVMA